MLQNLFYILFVSFVCLCWGLPVLYYQQKKKAKIFELTIEVIILSFFTGLIVIGALSAWISLFMPLQFPLLLFLTALVLIFDLVWLKKIYLEKTIQIHPDRATFNPSTIFFIVAIILFIFLASGSPVMDDTDLYHIQLIRWNQQYGTVPGLANLYLRDGFYSNWFHLISVFSLPFKYQNFLFLNCTISIWFVFFLIHKLRSHLSNGENKISRLLALFYFLTIACLLVKWELLRGNSSSTSYDFIVTVMLIMILSLITETILLKKEKDSFLMILIIFSVATPFFKITGAPALVILLVYLLISKQFSRKLFWTTGIFLFFLIPYLSKNYIQAGYPFFPYKLFSQVVNPDWKVPPPLLVNFSDYIHLGNRYINQSIPAEAWQHREEFSFGWISTWVKNLTIPDKIICLFVLVSLAASLFIPSFRKKENREIKIIYYSSFLLLLFWFFTSPDPRFAYGLLMFLAFLPAGYLAGNFLKKFWIDLGLLILSAAMLVYFFSKTKKIEIQDLIHPPGIVVPVFEKIKVRQLTFHLPGRVNDNWNIRCYDTPLPCICQLNPYLEPRGDKIKDGFRMRPITDSSFLAHFNY